MTETSFHMICFRHITAAEIKSLCVDSYIHVYSSVCVLARSSIHFHALMHPLVCACVLSTYAPHTNQYTMLF